MGEFELLARIRERLPAAGPRVRLGSGDDAAVTVPGGATATSVDALVEGVHFRRELAQPGADRRTRRSPRRSPTWRRWAPRPARPTSSSASPPTSTRTAASSCSTGCSRSPPRPGRPSPAATSPAPPSSSSRSPSSATRRAPERLRHPSRRPARRCAGRSPASSAAPPPASLLLERRGRGDSLERADGRAGCARASSSRRRGSPPAGRSPRPGRRR